MRAIVQRARCFTIFGGVDPFPHYVASAGAGVQVVANMAFVQQQYIVNSRCQTKNIYMVYIYMVIGRVRWGEPLDSHARANHVLVMTN
ncbi:unnamed protein product [Ectocarpus sp. 6 AP-2014]